MRSLPCLKKAVSSLSVVPAVLLISLAGCGQEDAGGEKDDTVPETPQGVFRVNTAGGGADSFPEFYADVVGTDPVILRACSKDPTPQVADDERTLCLRLHLDAAGLRTAGSPATLSIQGEARLSEPTSTTPASFTAATGHSPVVTTVWATVGCYAQRREQPLVQQLQGRLELEHNTAERLAGRLVLSSEGELRVTQCGDVVSADFDFPFELPRP